LLNQSVRLAGAGKKIEGVVTDIDELGRLVVRDGENLRYINSGEVSVVKK
jgi:biotin-(acetyl-CoA carboxylase) ligase